MKDPIVEEVRRVRAAIAASYDFDLHRMMAHARVEQYTWGHEVVSLERAEPEEKPRSLGQLRS